MSKAPSDFGDLSPVTTELLNKVSQQISTGELHDTLDLFTQAVETDPLLLEYSVYYFYLGTVLLHKSQYDKGINILQRAIEIDRVWGNVTIADADYKIGESEEKLGNLDEAIKFYERAAQKNEKYAREVSQLKEHLQSTKETVELIENAASQLLAKNYQEALNSYQKIVEIQPKKSAIWFNLGLSYYHLGSYHEAVKALEKSIKIDDEWLELTPSDAWFMLGLTFYFMGQNKRAILKLDRALNIDSSYINARIAINILTGAARRKQEAKNLAESGFEFLFQKNTEMAIDLFEKAVELDPSVSSYWVGLGVNLIDSKEYQKAVDAIDFAICLNNQWGRTKAADAWYYRGLASENLGKLDEAFTSYSQARILSQKKHRKAIAKYEELYLERITTGKKTNYSKENLPIKNLTLDEIITVKQPLTWLKSTEIQDRIVGEETLESILSQTGTLGDRQVSKADLSTVKVPLEWIESIQIRESRIDLLISVIPLLLQVSNSREIAGIIERAVFSKQQQQSFWVDLALSLTPIMYPAGSLVNYNAGNAIFKDYQNSELRSESEKYLEQLEPQFHQIDSLKNALDSRWQKEVEKVTNYWSRCLLGLSKWIEQMPKLLLDDTQSKLSKRLKKIQNESKIMLPSAYETIKINLDEAWSEID